MIQLCDYRTSHLFRRRNLQIWDCRYIASWAPAILADVARSYLVSTCVYRHVRGDFKSFVWVMSTVPGYTFRCGRWLPIRAPHMLNRFDFFITLTYLFFRVRVRLSSDTSYSFINIQSFQNSCIIKNVSGLAYSIIMFNFPLKFVLKGFLKLIMYCGHCANI